LQKKTHIKTIKTVTKHENRAQYNIVVV